MKNIDADEFKEQCRALFDNLDQAGLVVTRRGKPVVRLIPFEHQHAGLIGSLRRKVKIPGDILSTGIDRDAETES